MKRFLFAGLAASLIATTSPAQNRPLTPEISKPLINDVQQGQVADHPLTRYLEPASAMVIDLDVREIDVEPLVKWTEKNIAAARENSLPAEQIAMIKDFVESLTKSGVNHVYVTFSTRAIFDGGPVVVVPCEDSQTVAGLLGLLVPGMPPRPNYVSLPVAGAALFGPQAAVDRVHNGGRAVRPDLVLPLTRPDRMDHVATFALPATSREDLAAMWPEKLPYAPQLDISPRALAEDVSRIVLQWDLPPGPRVVAKVTATDATAGKRVESAIKQLLDLSPQAKQAVDAKLTMSTVTLESSAEKIAKMLEAIAAPARRNANELSMANDMKQIGLAMHNYHDVYNHFPPRLLTDPKQNPLLSWRVTILPYLEQQALYQAIRLDQAWDGPDNKQLGQVVIPIYAADIDANKQPGKTRVRVPVIEGSFWQGDGPPRSIRDLKDGTANTIAAIVAPATAAVTWTSPEAWVLSEDDPMSDVFGDRDKVLALLFDGSVRWFEKSDLDNAKLKALLTFAGGEKIDW